MDGFEFMYDEEGIGRLEHGKETLLQEFKAEGDGAACVVYVVATPARFYTVVVPAHTDCFGVQHPTYELGTGSGDEMRELALSIAKSVAEGMLVVRVRNEEVY